MSTDQQKRLQELEDNEALEVEMTTGDADELEIEIEDDTPPADRGKPRRPEGVEPDIPTDDELEQYSGGVKKRIQKLRYEYHEERRAKEAAERQAREAIEYAQRLRAELERSTKDLSQGRTVLVRQAEGRIKSELDQAKAAYKAAYEAGDSDGMLAATEKMSQLQLEAAQVRSMAEQVARAPAPTIPQPAAQPAAQPQVPRPDPDALAWAERNPWFGRETAMTGYAMGVHEELVRGGVAPNTKEYYSAIDRAMRQRFPEKFSEPEAERAPRRTSSVVAPGGRTAAAPRRVVLTQSEAQMAARLGLTPQQYAAEKLKLARSQQNG